MEIRNVPGENIDTVVSLARAAILRLETFGKVPEDLIRILLKIFQTSSIDSFNQIFQHMEKQRYLDQALATNGYVAKLSKEGIFKVATNQYRLQSWEEGTWNGTQVKGNQAVFTVGKSLCWNCGSNGHTLRDCKVPRDQTRISTNRRLQKKFLQKGKSKETETKSNGRSKNETKSDGKWRPPTSEERNRRVIDGKPMFYNRRLKKWVLGRDANSSANVSTTSDAASTCSTSTATTSSTTTTTNRTQLVLRKLSLRERVCECVGQVR